MVDANTGESDFSERNINQLLAFETIEYPYPVTEYNLCNNCSGTGAIRAVVKIQASPGILKLPLTTYKWVQCIACKGKGKIDKDNPMKGIMTELTQTINRFKNNGLITQTEEPIKLKTINDRPKKRKKSKVGVSGRK